MNPMMETLDDIDMFLSIQSISDSSNDSMISVMNVVMDAFVDVDMFLSTKSISDSSNDNMV